MSAGPKTTEWKRLQDAGKQVAADLFLQLNGYAIRAEQEAVAGESNEQRLARERAAIDSAPSLQGQRAAVERSERDMLTRRREEADAAGRQRILDAYAKDGAVKIEQLAVLRMSDPAAASAFENEHSTQLRYAAARMKEGIG